MASGRKLGPEAVSILDVIKSRNSPDKAIGTTEIVEYARQINPEITDLYVTRISKWFKTGRWGWEFVRREPGKMNTYRYYYDDKLPPRLFETEIRTSGKSKELVHVPETRARKETPAIGLKFDVPEMGFTLFVDTDGNVYKARMLRDD
jgi:hypothetical protein